MILTSEAPDGNEGPKGAARVGSALVTTSRSAGTAPITLFILILHQGPR